jgi:hypothetical protein
MPIRVSQTCAPVSASMPAMTIGLGPIRGIRMMLPTLAATAMHPTNGRNATPDRTAEYPRVTCM